MLPLIGRYRVEQAIQEGNQLGRFVGAVADAGQQVRGTRGHFVDDQFTRITPSHEHERVAAKRGAIAPRPCSHRA